MSLYARLAEEKLKAIKGETDDTIILKLLTIETDPYGAKWWYEIAKQKNRIPLAPDGPAPKKYVWLSPDKIVKVCGSSFEGYEVEYRTSNIDYYKQFPHTDKCSKDETFIINFAEGWEADELVDIAYYSLKSKEFGYDVLQ